MVSIQYLRALAALAVVLYHALQWRSGGFDVGRAGVDVFFVISGFVLWRATSRHRVTPLTFLAARASRVMPLYWLATLAVVASALVWPQFLPQVRPGWGHLLLSLAFIPHFDPRGLPFPTLPPGWSLDYEAGFYILFAIALAFARRWRAWALVGGLAGATLAGLLLADPAYILGANPLLLEFAAGVLIGVIDETRAQASAIWGVALSV
ncbi:MAG: acyltransferase, partial [Caulobacteraceae bacterium]